MIVFHITIVALAVFVNFVLLGFVYLRNQQSATHRLFALLTLIMSLWSVSNFFSYSVQDTLLATWLVRLVMFFAAPLSVVFFLLMLTFPSSKIPLSKKALWTWIILTIVTMVVALSPLLFSEIKTAPGYPPKPTPGLGMILFIPIGVGTIPLGIYYLIRKTIRARGIEKTQLHFILLGVLIMFPLIIVLNFIVVNAFNSTLFVPYAPLFTLPFTLLTAYTIIRHRLLDIRAAVARTLSFSFLVGGFFVIYGAILVFAVPFLARAFGIHDGIIASIGALLSVVIAQYVQRILRALTDRFLFQQRVNYRIALVKTSQALSRTIDIDEVTKIVLRAMRDGVRCNRAVIYLLNPARKSYQPYLTFGAHALMSLPIDHALCRHLRHNQGVIVKDELSAQIEQDQQNRHKEELTSLFETLNWLDMAVAVPLFMDKGLSGVILLGEKMSGTAYAAEETEFLSALAPQAATSLENARLYRESLEFGQKLKTEVERATSELKQANQQLKDLDRAKSEFLSIASHQLYTPLTALRGYLSMLKDGDYGDLSPKQSPIIEILNKSTLRLIELIKNLLDISRIESGRLELNLAKIDVAVMTKELVQDLMPNAMAKTLRLEFHEPAVKIPPVIADEQRLRQVLLNFVDNALKYTASGRVDVYLATENEQLVFRVTDTGKGLAPEEISRLFTKFTRAGDAARYHTEGTGLGLYVARQIVHEHHGEVEADSPGKERGSTFTMRLPVSGSPRSLRLGDKASVVIKAADAQGKPA